MNKAKALKLLNPTLAIVLILQAATGFSHDYLPREVFGYLHLIGAILLLSGVALHLFLNWNWVRANFLR